jgi:DNA-binding beta-propeller fold protein YncE
MLALAAAACAETDGIVALSLERTMSLPDVSGRIDHLAISPDHKHLAVAELENNSIDVVDVATGAALERVTTVGEPQGLAFDPAGRFLLAASRKDGALHLLDAVSLDHVVALPLGEDADNIRIDPRNGRAVVGYGDGALAIIDLDTRSVTATINLPAHPEGFQIDARTGRAFVNLPDARTIGVVDLDKTEVVDRWKLPLAMWNYPLALAPSDERLVTVFRAPASLVQFSRESGAETGSASTCGDADDVFYDQTRRRIYVACGGGGVDIFDSSGERPKRVGHVNTAKGARTALFDPALDRLFVAARSPGGGKPASILVFKPVD